MRLFLRRLLWAIIFPFALITFLCACLTWNLVCLLVDTFGNLLYIVADSDRRWLWSMVYIRPRDIFIAWPKAPVPPRYVF